MLHVKYEYIISILMLHDKIVDKVIKKYKKMIYICVVAHT